MDAMNPGSFRDPCGFLFERDGALRRQVNLAGKEDYDLFIDSGLYLELLDRELIISHQEVCIPFADPAIGYKVLAPENVPFISYPYEWSFGQLRDAALATLHIQELAFKHGMSLKDASAYNIQFYQGHPVLIDTLSFEKYREGEPWVAYRQFCQHFLAPLALISRRDIRLGQLLRVYIDGIPLDLAAALLPMSAKFNLSLYMHIFLHSRSQRKYQDRPSVKASTKRGKVSRLGFAGIISSLRQAVRKLAWRLPSSEWGNYYQETNYSAQAFEHKKEIVSRLLRRAAPQHVWDLGANTGIFSRLASQMGIPTVSFDLDPLAVENNYQDVRTSKERLILPLIMDLTNPSPGIGWAHTERASLSGRGPVDLVLSLALIHHLAIGNNLPFSRIAAFFHSIGRCHIMEFIPAEDSQVQRLLASRENIFGGYSQANFEKEFSAYFNIISSEKVLDSCRTIYLLESRPKTRQ